MKKYVITSEKGGKKTVAWGWIDFCTAEEAAKEVYDHYFDFIDERGSDNVPPMSEDNCCLSDAEKVYAAQIFDIAKNGYTDPNDDAKLRIEEIEVGALFAGTEDGDKLINLERLEGFDRRELLIPEDDAENVLRAYVEQFGELRITNEPYGWTVSGEDFDGDQVCSHYCWRPVDLER